MAKRPGGELALGNYCRSFTKNRPSQHKRRLAELKEDLLGTGLREATEQTILTAMGLISDAESSETKGNGKH